MRVDPRTCRRPRTTCLFLLLLGTAAPLSGADEVQFNRDIRPILSTKCFRCHGMDLKSRQGDLRLDTLEGATSERDGTFPVKPGDAAQSEVWRRITAEADDERMPPPDAPQQLTDDEKQTIRRWIEQGAPYQKHWAFETPVLPAEPPVRAAAWVRNPVDRFVLARLEAEGLSPRPEADRSKLIRRVALALTGLPPTPGEVALFTSDPGEQAYERMVDRYLNSPRYGEERARHWLDVARYADTHGLHLDNERLMWAYRDWVIGAFNRNLPFDEFTVEQLAGDLLPNPTQDQLIATGFGRCNVTTSEGGAIDPEFLFRYAVDRTSTTVQTWLGLTGGCAVCHDHKYDPLSSREFYQLYAFFYSAADPAMDRNVHNTDPFLKLMTDQRRGELDQARAREEDARRSLAEAARGLAYQDPAEVQPIPVNQCVQDVWLDDSFPIGAKVTCSSRNASVWSTPPTVEPKSGGRALHQVSAGAYQDKIENTTVPWMIPQQAVFRAWVRLDPLETPKALMLEFTATQGTRRALWGDANLLGAGEVGKPERLRIGDLPKVGEWVPLEATAEQLNLTAGEAVRGLALAQYGGIVSWDDISLSGAVSPATDPRSSLLVWWKSRTGQDTPGIPEKLVGILKGGPDSASQNDRDELRTFYLAHVARLLKPDLTPKRQTFEAAQSVRLALEESIPGTFIFRDLPQPRETFVMLRGQYDKRGEPVEPNVPAIFPPLKSGSPPRANRLDLAHWLLSAEHPLTARVTVNRFWQELFGNGLVKTSYDFGSQGDLPSHPELLDWLAVRFRESGWDVRELMRLLVTSATFRQDARVSAELLHRDPENRLYARGPRFRLDAEQVRDNALFVSGLIRLEMGGPGVKPYQPPNIWEPVGYSDSNTRYYLQDHGPALYRRSIYSFLKRTAPPPFMSNFDAPNREQFCTRRERSNTPLQALQLMNDVQHFEAARGLAQRLLVEGGTTPDERIAHAYLTVLARSPQVEEVAVIKEALLEFLARYAADPPAAEQAIHFGESPPPPGVPAVELAAYTLLANLILNLDETINRN